MRTAYNLLLDLRNRLDFSLRRRIHWRRGGQNPAPHPLVDPFANLPSDDRAAAEANARRLLADYDLSQLTNAASEDFRENLFYLELLERLFEQSGVMLPDPLAAADIGPSHWFYVQAEAALLKGWRAPHGRQFHLTGYEIDPYRVYADLRSRMDHAEAHMRDLPDVRYLPQAFSRSPGGFDVVLMLFPFIFMEDHLEWGLPGNLFQPDALLKDAWDSLRPGGLLGVVNQGQAEHDAERRSMARLGIRPMAAFRHDSLFFHYDLPRYALAAIHD
jgi:SAM-dependent methyltransferase